jgi:hypothetical protein
MTPVAQLIDYCERERRSFAIFASEPGASVTVSIGDGANYGSRSWTRRTAAEAICAALHDINSLCSKDGEHCEECGGRIERTNEAEFCDTCPARNEL